MAINGINFSIYIFDLFSSVESAGSDQCVGQSVGAAGQCAVLDGAADGVDEGHSARAQRRQHESQSEQHHR